MRDYVVMVAAIIFAQPINAGTATETKIGNFNFRTVSDPMTDASRGILASPSSGDIIMVVKCDSNGPGSLYMSLIAKHYLGAAQYHTRPVKFRIDGAPAEAIDAYYDDSTANFLDIKPNNEAGHWLARLENASKLTLQVTDFESESYTQVIDLDGFAQGVKQVAATCKDSNWQ